MIEMIDGLTTSTEMKTLSCKTSCEGMAGWPCLGLLPVVPRVKPLSPGLRLY